jgi:hypothetical protein
MDVHIDDIELQGNLLLATVSGTLASDRDAALRVFKQLCDTAKEKGVSKILVNTLAVDGEPPTVERYRVAIELAAYFQQHHMNPRLAIVGKQTTADGFGVRVAQNRWLTTELLSSQEEALRWLDKWPS